MCGTNNNNNYIFCFNLENIVESEEFLEGHRNFFYFKFIFSLKTSKFCWQITESIFWLGKYNQNLRERVVSSRKKVKNNGIFWNNFYEKTNYSDSLF